MREMNECKDKHITNLYVFPIFTSKSVCKVPTYKSCLTITEAASEEEEKDAAEAVGVDADVDADADQEAVRRQAGSQSPSLDVS